MALRTLAATAVGLLLRCCAVQAQGCHASDGAPPGTHQAWQNQQCGGGAGHKCDAVCEAGYYSNTEWKETSYKCSCNPGGQKCKWKHPSGGARQLDCKPLPCPSNPPEDHAQWSPACGAKDPGSICTAACQEGYADPNGAAAVDLVCKGGTTPHWAIKDGSGGNDASKHCVAVCPDVPPLPGMAWHGGCASKLGGAACTAVCAEGWEAADPTHITAQYACNDDSRAWATTDELVCKQECSASPAQNVEPCAGREGRALPIVGETCVAECVEGYTPQVGASASFTCGAGGQWQGGPLVCEAKQCKGQPGSDPHAQCPLVGSVGGTCAPQCLVGYTASDDRTDFKCGTDGTWEGGSITCTPVTCPAEPPFGSRNMKDCPEAQYSAEAPPSCVAACKPGFKAPDGENNIYHCNDNGRWTGGTLDCGADGKKTCAGDSPAPHSSFTAACDHSTPEVQCEAQCEVGYEQTEGSATYMCGAQGIWVPANDSMVCTAVKCHGSPADHADPCTGSYDPSGDENLCTARCSSGYEKTDGASEYQCDKTGNWVATGEALVCKGECKTAPTQNAKVCQGVEGRAWAVDGEECGAECKEGYMAKSGEATYTCSGDGNWTGGSLVCERKECLPYPPASHGTFNGTCGDVSVGAKCMAVCEEDYESAEPVEYTCESSGYWVQVEHASLACKGIECRDAPISNAKPCLGRFSPGQKGEVCHVTCVEGYTVKGEGEFQCQLIGDGVVQWVGPSNVSCVSTGEGPYDGDGGKKSPLEDGTVKAMIAACAVLLLCIACTYCRTGKREQHNSDLTASVLRQSFLGDTIQHPASQLAALDAPARWNKAQVVVSDDPDLEVASSGVMVASGATPRRRLKDGDGGNTAVMFTNDHIDELKPRNWKSTQMLGSGQFGDVYKVTWRGLDVAVKVIKLPERSENATEAATELLRKKMEVITKDFVTEVEICVDLNHPNLVQLLGYATMPTLLIVQELLTGQSVDHQLYVQNWQPSREQILKMAKDVAQGMEYLHTHFQHSDTACTQPIIHRDLKTPNLLLVAPPSFNGMVRGVDGQELTTKITDFGLSRDKALDAKQEFVQTNMMTGCGSVLWMAPEILLGEAYNESVDVFSYSMVLVELIARALPWSGVCMGAAVPNRVGRGERPISQIRSAETDLREIVMKCWNQRPAERPTFSDVVQMLSGLSSHATLVEEGAE